MKTKRATELLNVELSRISSALGVAKTVIAELPDGQAKIGLTSLIEKAEKAHASAFEHLQTISLHASMI
jgi:hypothetical protein